MASTGDQLQTIMSTMLTAEGVQSELMQVQWSVVSTWTEYVHGVWVSACKVHRGSSTGMCNWYACLCHVREFMALGECSFCDPVMHSSSGCRGNGSNTHHGSSHDSTHNALFTLAWCRLNGILQWCWSKPTMWVQYNTCTYTYTVIYIHNFNINLTQLLSLSMYNVY